MTFSLRNPEKKPGISFINSESMTEQSHKESCDIHTIMRQVKKTGVTNHVNEFGGTYMDMTSAPGFTEAQFIIADAKTMFESVPSHIRKDFENSPEKFLEFIQNPEKRDEIEAYGLDASHLPEATLIDDPVQTHQKIDKTSSEDSDEAEA